MFIRNASFVPLVAVVVLSGCGGGGGSDDAGSKPVSPPVIVAPPPAPVVPPAPPPATQPAPDPAPVVPPSPAPTPVVPPPVQPDPPPAAPLPVAPPAPPVVPTPVSDVPPSLAAPQAGSTAAIGSVGEGLWISTGRKGLVFVDDQERHTGFLNATPIYAATTWTGKWQFEGSKWAFASGGEYAFEHWARIAFPLAGNGTFNARQSFTGTIGTDGETTEPMAFEYSNANALAVKPSDLVGRWSSGRQNLTISADGSVSGVIAWPTLGECIVTGTAVQAYPGTAKNLFVLKVMGKDTEHSDCVMESSAAQGAQSFKAGITFINTSVTGVPFYRRSLTIFGAIIGGVIAGELVRD